MPKTQTITAATLEQRIDAAINRMHRAKRKHHKDVMMLDPKLAEALIDKGIVQAAAVADFDPGPQTKWKHNPLTQVPVRLKIPLIGGGSK